MEPSWEEALDVDDSDLQSTLLRPCKQQRRHEKPNSTTFTHLSQTLDASQLPSQPVNSLPQNLTSACQAEVTPPFRIIPGPAGIVQAAKLCKSRDNGSFLGQEEPPMATQEYIRRVVEDPEEDADFERNPWLSAIQFVSGDGMSNCVPSAPLGDIKKYLKNGKLDQVVAVIKSCAPNDLGDLMVVLKDPTGTVSGTIHHKVLTEGEFEKDNIVGSVLILHRVFYKDSGPSRKQIFHGCTIKDAAPGSDSGWETRMLRSAFSLEQEKVNPIVSSGHECHKTRNKGTNQKIEAGKETIKEADVIESGEIKHRAFERGRQPVEGESLLGSLERASNFVDNGNKNGLKGTDPVQVHVEPAMVSASLPLWTDKQLNELFDGDFEDDMSF